ncbi:MAG: hypothetical protein LW636_03355 [Planctomycetaceae bacterium]|nr:hypothetical protein [Planctomycetaceae bacterium]
MSVAMDGGDDGDRDSFEWLVRLLVRYLRASSLRDLGDAESLIRAAIEDLRRDDAELSALLRGKPWTKRHRLILGVVGRVAARRPRSASSCEGCSCDGACSRYAPSLEPWAVEAVEQQWARHVVSEACTRVGARAEGGAAAAAWRAFVECSMQGVARDEVARRLGVAPGEVSRLASQGSAMLRAALLELFREEGVVEELLEDELVALQQALLRSP